MQNKYTSSRWRHGLSISRALLITIDNADEKGGGGRAGGKKRENEKRETLAPAACVVAFVGAKLFASEAEEH